MARSSEEKDPIGAMLGLVSSGPPKGADETPEEPEEVDAEAEAFNAAASELLTAIESKNVSAMAAALRAACEAHYDQEMGETE